MTEQNTYLYKMVELPDYINILTFLIHTANLLHEVGLSWNELNIFCFLDYTPLPLPNAPQFQVCK